MSRQRKKKRRKKNKWVSIKVVAICNMGKTFVLIKWTVFFQAFVLHDILTVRKTLLIQWNVCTDVDLVDSIRELYNRYSIRWIGCLWSYAHIHPLIITRQSISRNFPCNSFSQFFPTFSCSLSASTNSSQRNKRCIYWLWWRWW